MGRAFRVELRSDGIAVIVDYESLHELVGLKRMMLDEVLEGIIARFISKCLSMYQVVKRQDVFHMEILCRGASKYDYGVIERCVDNFERSLGERLAARRHVLFTFFVNKPLTDVEVAVYRVLTMPPNPYKALGRLCRVIMRDYGYLAERLGRTLVVFPVTGEEELPQEVTFDLNGLKVTLSFEGVRHLKPDVAREADCLKRLLSRALKSKLKSRGFIVKGLKALRRYPTMEDERVEVRRGFEFSVMVFSDGQAALALSPKSEVLSKLTLWEEYEGDYEKLIRSSSELSGRVAKRVYDESAIRILKVEELKVSEAPTGTMSVLDRYGVQGLLRGYSVSIEEPTVVGLLRGEEVREAPSMLRLVYTLKELKRMNVTEKLTKFLHSPPQTWLREARDFIKSIGEVDLGGEVIGFIDEPPEVDLL